MSFDVVKIILVDGFGSCQCSHSTKTMCSCDHGVLSIPCGSNESRRLSTYCRGLCSALRKRLISYFCSDNLQAAEPQGLDGILELFQGNNRKPIVIGLGLCFLQAFSGSNTVIYFASSVFNEMGLSSKYLLSLAVGLPNLAGAVASLYLTDNWGRRPLLLSSFAAMVVALLVLAISIAPLGLGEVEIPLYGYGSVAVGTLAALTCIPVYVFAFSAGAGPIPWLLYSELFPVSVCSPPPKHKPSCLVCLVCLAMLGILQLVPD